MSEPVRLNLVHFPVTALGPLDRALVVLQGCARGCPGCMARHTWRRGDGANVTVAELLAKLSEFAKSGATRLTVTGGEPFEQPEALRELLEGARALGYTDRLVYTGFTLEELSRDLPEPLAGCDALVDGPYLRDEPAQEPWRGSANQRLHLLSRDPELAALYDRFRSSRPARRELQIVERNGAVHLVGIPAPGDAERILDELDGLAQGLPHLRL